MRTARPILAALLAAGPWVAHAAPAAASTAAPATPGMAGELVRVVLGLAAVVGMILLAGWLGRRAQSKVRPGGRHMRCLETLAVGMKERVLLVEVGERQLVVGVSPGGLRTLLVLDEKLPDSGSPATPGADFRSLLGQWRKSS